MAIAARSRPALHRRHGRSGRRPADQRGQNTGGRDCRVNDPILRTPVLIVTPLRALSAQTERSFRKTFAPLGFGVSSLYGASGLSAGDEDALRTREIIIAGRPKIPTSR